MRLQPYADSVIIGLLVGAIAEVPSWKWAAILLGYFTITFVVLCIDRMRGYDTDPV